MASAPDVSIYRTCVRAYAGSIRHARGAAICDTRRERRADGASLDDAPLSAIRGARDAQTARLYIGRAWGRCGGVAPAVGVAAYSP